MALKVTATARRINILLEASKMLFSSVNKLLKLLLGITGHRSEVQLMFGSEDHVLGADLQDGRGLKGRGYSKQGQLRWCLTSIVQSSVLTVEELQATLEIQRLETSR